MTTSSSKRFSPQQSVMRECDRRGDKRVVDGCVALLSGDDADPELIVALGGPPARWALTGEPSGPAYWLRVWGARGLLWNWNDEALPVIVAALRDDSWRVREMAIKVVARHRLDDATPAVAALQEDSNQRVRAAAARALVLLGQKP